MSANEELAEHAHHTQEPFERRVAVTMAIIAAVLATVSVIAHVLSNEELLAQQQSSDQYAFYQAKSIRRYASDIARDTFKSMGKEAETDAYAKNAERYQKEGEEILKEADHLKAESVLRGRQAFRMESGEVFLEIGIVLASLAILTKRPLIWMGSLICSAIGVAISLTAAFVS
jgi:hypothetical protein